MGITFTSDARPPSGTRLLPNQFLRPAFGELYGFDADADEAVTIDGALTTELSEPLTAENGDILQFEPVGGAPAGLPSITNTYSVDLDGSDDYVEVGNVSGLTGTSFSISAWFYLTANPSGEGIFGAGSSSSDRIWLQVLDSNTIRFGSLGNIDTFDLSSGTFSLNTWYHVVGVIDGTSKEVFINGSSLGTTTVSSLSGTNGNNVRIGSLPSQTSAFFALNPYQGILDELAVFNTALSSTNVSRIYNSGVPADISSLNPVGWWRMGDNDGGTGATITDQGSGGNDGTLTNGPTFSTTVPS